MNYPPSNHSQERALNGPDIEYEETVFCNTCQVEVVATVYGNSEDSWYYATCEFCHNDIEVEAPEPDYDAIAEMKADALLDDRRFQ